MDPDRLARLEALERQLHHLRRIQERLRSSARIFPGQSTFWTGTARDKYEEMVLQLDEALDSADAALVDAIDRTSITLAAVRHG